MKAELKGGCSLKEDPCICFFFKFYQNKNFLSKFIYCAASVRVISNFLFMFLLSINLKHRHKMSSVPSLRIALLKSKKIRSSLLTHLWKKSWSSLILNAYKNAHRKRKPLFNVSHKRSTKCSDEEKI